MSEWIKWSVFALLLLVLLAAFGFTVNFRALFRRIKEFLYKKSPQRRPSLKVYRARVVGEYKDRVFEKSSKYLERVRTEKELHKIRAACRLLGVGFLALGLLWGNVPLSIVLGALGYLLPYWAVRYVEFSKQRFVTANAESALAAITSTYLRTGDIVSAVEENLPSLEKPISDCFGRFVTEARYVNNDTVAAIDVLFNSYDNDIFQEWCRTLKKCVADSSLRESLPPIVAKFGEVKAIQMELESAMREPLYNFIMISILAIGTIPLMYLVSREWYVLLVSSAAGKFAIAILLAVILFGINKAMDLLEPIKIKR